MKKKLIVFCSSTVAMLGATILLASPVHANPDAVASCAAEVSGCRLVSQNCYSGWSSTGDPVRWCDCGYKCG